MTQLLEENLDDLEGALKPLLETSIIDTANTLPVLERSKLYVLVTYAIESLIFCTQFCYDCVPIAVLNRNSFPTRQRC